MTELKVTGNVTGTSSSGSIVHEDYVFAVTAAINEPRTRIVVDELTLIDTTPDGTLVKSNSISITGLHAVEYVNGDKIYVYGATTPGINGVFTVDSATQNAANTQITVQESMASDPTPDGKLIHEDHMYAITSFEADPQTELKVTGDITGTTATGVVVHEDNIHTITAGINEPRTRIVVTELTLNNATIDGTLAEAYYVIDVENNELNTVDVSINSFSEYSNRNNGSRRRAIVLAE
jgi:hypothetical protein